MFGLWKKKVVLYHFSANIKATDNISLKEKTLSMDATIETVGGITSFKVNDEVMAHINNIVKDSVVKQGYTHKTHVIVSLTRL